MLMFRIASAWATGHGRDLFNAARPCYALSVAWRAPTVTREGLHP